MLGGFSDGPLESLMRRSLEASALDSLETAIETGRFGHALLLTDGEPEQPVPAGVEVELDRGEDFHFGQRLADAVAEHDLRRALYLGGGAGPLLAGDDFVTLAASMEGETPACLTNNFYSDRKSVV